MVKQKISIGRIVHVRHSSVFSNGATVAPAIVTRVWNPDSDMEMVNVTAWPDLGFEKHIESLREVGSKGTEEGWFWPERT